MKTITLCLLLSLSAFAADPVSVPKKQSGQTATGPVVNVPLPHAMTDKQRGDFWLASYKAVQAELTIAKAHIEADEKLLLDPASKEREKAGQVIVQACPEAKLDASGDIACPPAKPEEPKSLK